MMFPASVVSLLLSTVTGAVSDSSFNVIRNVDGTDYLVFNVAFDQAIYAKQSASAEPRLLSDPRYQKIVVDSTCPEVKVAAISLELKGFFNIKCTGPDSQFAVPSTQPKKSCSATSAAVVVQPVANPGGAFINLLKGGLTIPLGYSDNVLAIVYPLNSEGRNFFKSEAGIKCDFETTSKKGASLQYKEGQPITLPTGVVHNPITCSSSGLDILSQKFQLVASRFEFENIEAINQLATTLKYFEYQEMFSGCKSNAFAFIENLRNTTRTVPETTICTKAASDPAFATDPCCSKRTALTQCCYPRSADIPVLGLGSLNQPLIQRSCKNPTKITSLLSDLVVAYKDGLSIQDIDLNNEFRSSMTFFESCKSYLMNSACRANGDCPYFMACGRYGTCEAPYATLGSRFLACALRTIPEDLKVAFLAKHQIPFTDIATTEQIHEIYDKLISPDDDCIGPVSSPYETTFKVVRDENGNFINHVQAANIAACKEERKCNYEGKGKKSEADCTSQPNRFCGSCKGNECLAIDAEDGCSIVIDGVDAEIACRNKKGKFRKSGSKGKCFFKNPAHCKKLQNSPTFENLPATIQTTGSCPKKMCSNNNLDEAECTSVINSEICPDGTSNCDVCDDFEYYNSNGGLCTFVPEILFNCGLSGYTQNGICVDLSVNDRKSCQAKNMEWKPRSTTQADCLAKGTFCVHHNGALSLLSSEACRQCGGTPGNRYTWGNPIADASHLLDAAWTPTNWVPKNKIMPALTLSKLKHEFESAAAGLIARDLFNNYQRYINKYLAILKTIACDCIEKESGCFDSKMKWELKSCEINPLMPSECEGIFLEQNRFKTNSIVGLKVFETSVASFIANTTTVTTNAISKRCNPISYYEVVNDNNSNIVGQLIGNARSFQFTEYPTESTTICLDIDYSIPQDAVKYPYYDVAVT